MAEPVVLVAEEDASVRLTIQISAIPVVVLTGLERETNDDWPGTLFVAKPFDPGHLISSDPGRPDG